MKGYLVTNFEVCTQIDQKNVPLPLTKIANTMHYILTGATRGIGYATLVALAGQQPKHRIVVLVRQAATLAAIQAAYPNIKVIAIDLAAPKTAFVPALEQAMQFLDHKVEVLINN